MQHSPRFLKLVDEVKANIQQCDIETVKQWQDEGENFVLIDNREQSEWAKSYIRGAVYLGKGILERDIEAAYPDLDTKIVVYCGGGFRSALSVESLVRMGYRNVISMDGGFRAWSLANYPLDVNS